MKQTAVEWLATYLKGITTLNCDDIIEQAKAMEKEQIEDAYTMGSYDMADKKFNPSEYYNETFKSE